MLLCWLLEVSVGPNWPVRTPPAVSSSLPIPERKWTISSIDSLILTRRMATLQRILIFILRFTDVCLQLVNQHFVAWTKPGTSSLPASDVDRFGQKQVRTGRRTCVPSKTSDHPAATGETTCLYQDGSHASGASGEDASELETSSPRCAA